VLHATSLSEAGSGSSDTTPSPNINPYPLASGVRVLTLFPSIRVGRTGGNAESEGDPQISSHLTTLPAAHAARVNVMWATPLGEETASTR
jgi:hypothetical protein